MKLEFDFDARIVNGSQILFIQPVNPSNFSKIILDCCAIKVTRVSVLKFFEDDPEPESVDTHLQSSWNWFQMPTKESSIAFDLNKWSLTLSNWSCPSGKCQFPKVLRINYETLPETPSLHWRPTQGFSYSSSDSSKSVYIPASPVNNRGLFPCQEHPSAMATWECFVIVKKPFLPLLSSDEPGQLIHEMSDTETSTFYFRTEHVMPMSTFAIVIGIFSIYEEIVEESQCDNLIPTRLYSLSCDVGLSNIRPQFEQYIKNVLVSAHKILGPHPFSRLDIVIMPRCFHTLSLTNPHMIFVSGSVFTGSIEPLFYSSLPHEIGHSWFGLSIGALDWTEEWLSEGFATFTEDVIYKEAMKLTFPECCSNVDSDIGLKACIRLFKLQNELGNNSEASLKKLIQVQDPEASNSNSIKNGLVPLKQFTQVHYLKGYFFLHHLSQLVGYDQFLKFLKEYVHKFEGKLVTSTEFLNYFETCFESSLKSNSVYESVPKIIKDWLENADLMEPLRSVDILNSEPNLCIEYNCNESLERISKVYSQLFVKTEQITEKLNSSELIILFEKILTSPKSWFSTNTIQGLVSRLSFQPEEHNPEVQHRFCEIILKFCLAKSKKSLRSHFAVNFKRELDFLREFLLKHPAMGVYLYGELMISENRILQEIARSLYLQQLEVLDPEARHVILSMIQ